MASPHRAPAPPRAADLAERFMRELSSTVRRSPAPLPMPFAPMAEKIAGPRRVMLSTDAASRRALRSVGKVAATTGDTIHLDPRPIRPARLAEVVAHELTHVAHPSPVPRFFDDIDDSPEERRAERTAAAMARSRLAPSASTIRPTGGGLVEARPPSRRVIRRSPADPPVTKDSGGSSDGGTARSIRAADLAAGISRTRRDTPVIRRDASSSTSNSGKSDGGLLSADRSSASGQPASTTTKHEDDKADFRRLLDANLDYLMRLISDRTRSEIDGRGGRLWREL